MTREMMIGTRETFTYARCLRCASLSLIDEPADMGKYYPEDGYYSLDPAELDRFDRASGRGAVHAVWAMTSNRGAARSRALLERGPVRQLVGAFDMLRALRVAGVPLAGARVLDVGSGAGISTAMLGVLGCEALGIDPFGPTWERANARQVRTTLDTVEGQWDVILFQHSLEHVPQPRLAIAKARELLAADGRIVVRIPTVDSLAYREYGGDWIDLDPPRHYFVPSREGLTAMCGSYALELVTLYDDARDIQFWGSELYRRNQPLGSEDPDRLVRTVFSKTDRRRYLRRTRDLNRIGEGDLITAVYRCVASEATIPA